MTHCRVEQDLNKHLEEEETTFAKMDALEDKVKIVEDDFRERARVGGLDEACYWLAGAYIDESIANAASIILGVTSDYFESLVAIKAQELLDADQPEPDAPDYD